MKMIFKNPRIFQRMHDGNQKTWYGRCDYALLLVAVQTGLRLSELTGLQREDVQLGVGAHVRCVGKGRKERCTPLTKITAVVLKTWLAEPSRHSCASSKLPTIVKRATP
jgi:integrase